MEPEWTDEATTGSKLKSSFLELIEFVAIVVAVLAIIRFFIAEPHKVSGHSMVPNFQDGDFLITNKLAMRIGSLQRGEVVILHYPKDPDKVFIKRIIGLPTEHVKLLGGKIYINNQPLDEPYLPIGLSTPGEQYLSENQEVVVPNDAYFVIGDNRGGSSDSRDWGPVKLSFIIGQAWLRYWPPKSFTLLKISTVSTY